MAWSFRKRIRLAKGLSLNLFKSGIGLSVGGKGLTVSSGKRGTYVNASLPGTGLSARIRIDNLAEKIQDPQSGAEEGMSPSPERSKPSAAGCLPLILTTLFAGWFVWTLFSE